jgi:DNA-binding PadR family transcriptional regulator
MSAVDVTPPGLELALLGFLREGPLHAYELHRRLVQAETLGLVWRLKQSHLYALLGRLEAAGLLVGTTQPQGARPPRRVLALTPAGQEAFARWLTTPVAHGRDLRLEFLAKLFFAARNSPPAVSALVERQHAACADWLADLHAQVDATPASQPFATLVLQFRIRQIEGILGWLDLCASTLLAAPRGA